MMVGEQGRERENSSREILGVVFCVETEAEGVMQTGTNHRGKLQSLVEFILYTVVSIG